MLLRLGWLSFDREFVSLLSAIPFNITYLFWYYWFSVFCLMLINTTWLDLKCVCLCDVDEKCFSQQLWVFRDCVTKSHQHPSRRAGFSDLWRREVRLKCSVTLAVTRCIPTKQSRAIKNRIVSDFWRNRKASANTWIVLSLLVTRWRQWRVKNVRAVARLSVIRRCVCFSCVTTTSTDVARCLTSYVQLGTTLAWTASEWLCKHLTTRLYLHASFNS